MNFVELLEQAPLFQWFEVELDQNTSFHSFALPTFLAHCDRCNGVRSFGSGGRSWGGGSVSDTALRGKTLAAICVCVHCHDFWRGYILRFNEDGTRIMKAGQYPPPDDAREHFFSIGSQHDAYIKIRELFQKARNSITVVDPYLDGSIFTMLSTIISPAINVRLLTHTIPSDFTREADKFSLQHENITFDVRRSKEFHDRFLIIDNTECWHIGCSIKDADNKAFMLSQIEDQQNRETLITQQS